MGIDVAVGAGIAEGVGAGAGAAAAGAGAGAAAAGVAGAGVAAGAAGAAAGGISLGTAASLAAGIGAIGLGAASLLAPKPKFPGAPPPLPSPLVAPTMNSDAVTAAAKKQALISQMQSGRASTILSSGTGSNDKLGA